MKSEEALAVVRLGDTIARMCAQAMAVTEVLVGKEAIDDLPVVVLGTAVCGVIRTALAHPEWGAYWAGIAAEEAVASLLARLPVQTTQEPPPAPEPP
jgi:hypothetical protein